MYLSGNWPLAATKNFQSQITDSIKCCPSQRFTVMASNVSTAVFEFYFITDLAQNLHGGSHLGSKQPPSVHILRSFWEKQWLSPKSPYGRSF